MSVGNSGIEADHLISQFLLQEIHQFLSLLIADMTGRMIFNFSILNADEVTTHSHFSLFN
ncbi:hypothetical protein SDC9_126602 [bioreactor metagenome]|uniref:Uncharacterized protein n=1 Tax=bioreactor metagenome TaxID=1076179 RepID=A0A645CRP5_9ZZZZ